MTGDYKVSSVFYNKYRTNIENKCFLDEYEWFASGEQKARPGQLLTGRYLFKAKG
jgi:hypothetical protein